MAGYQDILNQYLAADPATNPDIFKTDATEALSVKTREAEAISEQKRNEARKITTMGATGSGYQSANQRDRDYVTLTPHQFRIKYGNDVAGDLQANVSNMDATRRGDMQDRREGSAIIGDSIDSGVTGFLGSFAGIAALGAGAVNDDAGIAVSRIASDINKFGDNLKSNQANNSKRAYSTEMELRARDNKKLKTGLARVAQDAVDSMSIAASDPTMAGEVISSGIGSLFAGGPISKGLKAAGAASVGKVVSARIAAKAGERIAMPAAIAAMEAGGAYQQTAQEAYDRLADRIDLTEEQKVEMANNAGLMAAAIQAPVGAATGLLVSRFEAKPFKVGSVRGALKNIGLETIEEGIQSGSGQAAQNLAISQEVDTNQDVIEGIGEQAGLGAVGGFGAAGTVQTPGVALRGAIEIAKLPFRAAGAALTYRGNLIEARNLKVQDDILNGLHDQAIEAAPEARTEAEGIVDAMDAPEEQKAPLRAFIDRTMSKLSGSVKIQDVAKRASDATANVRDRLQALTELSSLVQDSEAVQAEETPETFKDSSIRSIKDVIANAAQSKIVQNALDQGKELYTQSSTAINSIVKNTVEKIEEARNNKKIITLEERTGIEDASKLIVGMAEQTPDQVDPVVVDKLLYHSENGSVNLTPQQKTVLRSASATARAVQQGSDLASKYGLPDAEEVSRQVLTNKPKEGSNLSLYGHLQGIRAAYNAGDLKLATDLFTELRGFANSQINKVAAFNSALVGGNTSSHNPVVYNAHIGQGKFRPIGKVNLSPTNINSVRIAQQVAVEAVTLAQSLNNLSDAFADLGIEHVDIPVLDASLDGEANVVAEEYRTGKRMVPGQEVSEPTDQPVSAEREVIEEPAPIVEEQPSQEVNLDQVEEVSKSVADEPQVEEITSEPDVVEDVALAEPNQEEELIPVNPKTIDEAYPNLIGDTLNRFRIAFKIPTKKSTRTFNVESPMTVVKDGLENETTFRRLVDGDLNRKYNSEVAEAYSQYLNIGDELLVQLNERLQNFISKPAILKAGIGKAVTYLNGQALNIVEQQEDGGLHYNQKLIQNAMLAGLQWFLKMNQYSGNLDEKDVRSLLRLPADEVLPEGLIDEINDAGVGPAEMARSLSREIQRFWGLELDGSQPRNYAEGVSESIAKEILDVMVEAGFLTLTEVDISQITIDENITKLNRYRMATDEENNKIISPEHPIRQFPTAIEKAVLFDSEEVYYIGEPPKSVSKTQLRNQAVENTPDQIKSIEKQQAVPHLLNMPFVDVLRQMSEPMVLRLFGGGDIDNLVLNVNHKKTLAGRNLTVQSAYLSIMSLVQEVSNKASMDKVDVSEMPVYFNYNDTVVNRAQMLGKDNPQSNKLMREAILPTWKEVDLNDPQMRTNFFMGLAQALGEKVHTQSNEESIRKLMERLQGFEKTIEILNDNSELKFTPEAIDTMKAEGVNSIVGFHALMEYARFQNTEDKSKFRTAIYFEADGVTNGVVNAMALFSSGPFNAEWLDNIARGGYHVGEEILSLAQIRNGFAKNSADLYGLAGTKTTEAVSNLRTVYASNSEVMDQFNAVRDLLTEFFDGVSFEGNQLIVDRGATKNPLTITIYGSGAKGIAGNITDAVISKLYERMSLAAQRKAADKDISEAQAFFGGDKESAQIKFTRLVQNLNLVIGNRLTMNDGEMLVNKLTNKKANSFGDPKAFTFSTDQIRTIRENMLYAFVNPMVEGITKTVGSDLMETLGVVKTQVQAWSLIGKFAYQQVYEQALEAKRKANPDMKDNDILSRNEEDKVLKSVWDKLPYFSTGSQNFLFGMKQATDRRTEFGRDFTENFRTPAFGYTPDDAGVSGIPGITIGAGDGQTVLNAVNDPEMPEGFLQIFDGIHSSVADMQTMGLVANRAVFKAWKGNPLRDLSEAFSKFVSNIDLSDLTEEQRKALTKSLFPPNFWRTAQNSETLENAFRSLAKQGDKASKAISERHAVMQRIQSSVDQMAGAATPYQNGGIILSGSVEQKAAAMERLRSNVQPEQENEKRETTLPSAKMVSPVSFKQASVPLLTKMLDKQINKITNDRVTRALVRDVVRSGRVDNYEIYIGTRDEILNKANEFGITIPSNRSNFSGFMDPNSNSIFVVDGNPETILHELIHAATYEAVQAHYDGSASKDVSDAVVRLEGLMDEFKQAAYEGEISGSAIDDALDEMERQASEGNQAGELNEFMAWSLANADLAAQLQKTKVVNKTLRIARSVVQAIKALLWNGKRSAAVKDDLFTNIRFNTNIIMRSPTIAEQSATGLLYHNPSSSNHLNDLMNQIKAKLSDNMSKDNLTRIVKRKKMNPALVNAARASQAFQNAGFNMTKQEQMAFINMVTVMGTDAELDANSTIRMQEIFTHVGNHLSVESFMRNPEANDSFDIEQATQKFNVLMGKFAARKDAYDRSIVLPAFVALATTNEEFRKILKQMEMPKAKYAEWNSVDNILDNIGETGINNLSRLMSGEGINSKNVQDSLDNLIEQMLETSEESQLYIEKFTTPVGNTIDRINQVVIDGIAYAGTKTNELANYVAATSPDSKLKNLMAGSLNTVTRLMNEDTGKQAATNFMSVANKTKVWRPVYDLLKDLIGRTDENYKVYDLIKIARAWVNGIRQQYREQFPHIINSKFTKQLTAQDQTDLFKGLGETGFASLLNGNKIEKVFDLLENNSSRDVEIRNILKLLSESSSGYSTQQVKLIEAKARQLASYMITKQSLEPNLLRNAQAIANLLGETNGLVVPNEKVINAIDHLVSLYALNNLDEATRSRLSLLVQSEASGLGFVLSYLQGQDEIDRAKATGNAKYNYWKGHMPSETAHGVSLIVSRDAEGAKLIGRSYTRLKAYSGSSNDPTAGKRGYYFAPVSARAPYSQGIMQNVQQTVSGVDKATGFSLGLTAGVITDPLLVQRVKSNRTKETGNTLLPVYDENGVLFAYERSIEPDVLDKLQSKTNISDSMGIRSGRQIEEELAFNINKTLIDRLREMYDADKTAGRTNEYINLLTSTDPIHKDSVKIFSRETDEYIRARFPEGFYVRKDMIDDAIGYRSASVGDAWTGNSRWSDSTQDHVKKILMGMFGNNAYRYAVKSEEILQNVIQDIRVAIVIKSVVVPMANAVSNIFQLIGRGVPATQIFRSIPKKTAEIESWHKSRLRQIEAEAELLATTDIIERRRLEAEIQTIKDAHKRLSIWPLLEAGEFSSVSDAGARDDILLTEGKLSEYLERATNKLPDSVKTAGKYAIMSKDTALFRALQKSVEYGDFVAKAIMYDDLIKRQKMSKADALGRITEEFVNYDRLPGRDRAYLEGIGLLWFYNFKIRSAKVAVSMMRNNPVHALIAMSLPLPITGIGIPMEDNLWATLFDGRATNSMGFGMAMRAPGLLPTANLIW